MFFSVGYYGDLFSDAETALFVGVAVAICPFMYGPCDIVGCIAVFEAPDVFGQLCLGLIFPVLE